MITKEVLINRGVALFARKGYHSTSIKDIITEAKIPKGSFYYYFESKELFGLEIINFYADQIGLILKKYMVVENDPVQNVKQFFELLLDNEKGQLYRSMKTLHKLHHELNESNELFAQALSLTYQNFISEIIGHLRILESNNELKPGTDIVVVIEYLFFSSLGIMDQNGLQQKALFFEIFDYLLEKKSE